MRKLLILLIIICSNITFLFAEGSKELFNKANAYYQKGDYEKASVEYKGILKEGYESAELYYNLGNCYYKLNEMPQAIVNYEKAKKLAPEDEDIEFNLKLANLKIVDKIEPIPQLTFKSWWIGIANLFSSQDWAIFTIICFALACLCGILFLFINSVVGKKIIFVIGLIVLAKSFLLVALGSTRTTIEREHNTAVLIKPDVYVKSSPNEKSADLFILHEGAKVNLLDEIGKWKRIRLANGNEGWIQSEALEVI